MPRSRKSGGGKAAGAAAQSGRCADPVKWFGDPSDRRPTVESWRIERLASAPEGARPLPRTVAWFAAHAMLHGGVFSGLQVDQWLKTHDGKWPRGRSENAQRSYRQRFVQPFFNPRFSGRALAATLRFPGGATFGHFSSRPAYAAVGVENSRYRRTAAMPLVMQRLLAYDYVLERPDLGWVGESDQKLALFDAVGVPRSLFPRRAYKAGARPGLTLDERLRAQATAKPVPEDRTAFFPDHMPIGYGPWRIVFVVPCPPDAPGAVAGKVREFAPFWRALRASGVRVGVVFVLRGDEDLKGPVPMPDVSEVARPADQHDRERLLIRVERHVLSAAGPDLSARLAMMYSAAGTSAAVRLKHLDEVLAAARSDAEGGPESSASGQGPMEVSCFVSERLASSRWNVLAPAAVQQIR